MGKLNLYTILKTILTFEIILALGFSIFLLADKVIMLNQQENKTGKYKDILIPRIQYNNGNTFGRSFDSEGDQEKNDYNIIRYDLYLLNTENGEITSVNK